MHYLMRKFYSERDCFRTSETWYSILANLMVAAESVALCHLGLAGIVHNPLQHTHNFPLKRTAHFRDSFRLALDLTHTHRQTLVITINGEIVVRYTDFLIELLLVVFHVSNNHRYFHNLIYTFHTYIVHM